AAKLDEAVERYEERFGARPTSVHLHPAQAEGLCHGRLHVLGDVNLRRNHFLLGMEEADPSIELVSIPHVAASAPQASGALEAPGPSAHQEASPPRRRRASRGRKANPSLGDIRRQSTSRRAS
ncbi:MAG TPA: hypothetical protein VH590_14130, partial [Ktedonobacterales bacterium]